MTHIKVKGFVIREVPVGDFDRIINILTAEQGLVSASARGARRTKSPLLLSTQVFSLSEFELFAYKGHFTVNSAELIESFGALHKDLDRLVCASHLAEVLFDCMKNDVAQPNLYRLWAYSLQALQSQADPLLTVHVAQLRLLAEIGFMPHLESCVICGNPISHAPIFSISACGLVCSRPACQNKSSNAKLLAEGVLNAMEHSIQAPISRLFNFTLSPKIRQEFILISEHYLTHQMEKEYTRLQLLQGLDSLTFQEPPSV